MKEIKGILFCAGGYSSSILAQRLNELGKDFNIHISECGLGSKPMEVVANEYDIVLFAPHLSTYYDDYEELFEEKGVPFLQIIAKEYVAVNAESLFEKMKVALKL
ncbi:hypothetical protein [Spiroplasma endosymbiont of Aspidapion aeneum]|uniref:PTS sugar transporter subunit IIB n=1 Tax=Spiroplasma endosymbiont of Aspidapion aeneum TaxID=3066276 RepID=UPI00313D423A